MSGTVTSCPRCGAETKPDWGFCPRCAMALDTASFDLDAFSDRIRYVTRSAENRTRRNIVLRSLPNLVWGVVVFVVVGGGVLLFHPDMVPSLFKLPPLEIGLEEPPSVGDEIDTPALTGSFVPFVWIEIPEGEFQFGRTGNTVPEYLPAFEILKYEVTNDQWYQYLLDEEERLRKKQLFEKAVPRHWNAEPGPGVPNPPEELWEKPVVYISWEQAQDFCRNWLARQPGCSGARLPTREEWEKASRGPDDDRPYPWGNSFMVHDCISDIEKLQGNFLESGIGEVVGVGSFTATDVSPYGVAGMGGNVAEFVGGSGSHWFRGGAFNMEEYGARLYDETEIPVNDWFTWSYVGFRVARSPRQ